MAGFFLEQCQLRISSANTKSYPVRVRTTRVGRDIDTSDVKIFTSERRPLIPCLGTNLRLQISCEAQLKIFRKIDDAVR
jgi:hypothetical protein